MGRLIVDPMIVASIVIIPALRMQSVALKVVIIAIQTTMFVSEISGLGNSGIQKIRTGGQSFALHFTEQCTVDSD